MPRPTTIRRRLLLTGIVGLASLVAAEVVVRLSGVAREVGPSFTEWHATDGVHIRRSIQVTRTTSEYTMTFTSNAAGFRGPELPPTIERSLLLLGDSFTMGYGVDDGDVFAARLAGSMPPGCTVVNAGIGGTGNGRWLHVLEREHARLRPAVVVLQICSNDVDDNVREGLFTLAAEGRLVAHAPAPPSAMRRLQGWIDAIPGASSLHLVGLGRQIGARGTMPPDAVEATAPTAGPAHDLFLALVRAAVDRVRESGALPLLFTADATEEQARPLRELGEGLGVPVLRMPSRAERPELYYRVDGHWNAAGHRHVAEQLAAALAREPFASRLQHAAK